MYKLFLRSIGYNDYLMLEFDEQKQECIQNELNNIDNSNNTNKINNNSYLIHKDNDDWGQFVIIENYHYRRQIVNIVNIDRFH
jgi:quinol monooxygenase YgiN